MKSDAFSQLIRKRRTALAISPVQLARKAGVNMAVVGALEPTNGRGAARRC
jgi:predicted transcriptional regulator